METCDEYVFIIIVTIIIIIIIYIIKKMINIAIRATCYIFCCRNRNWDSPDLMQFRFLFFSFLFCFVLFLIIQSQAAFVNCLYVVWFTIYCTFKNTNKVSINIINVIIIWTPSSLKDGKRNTLKMVGNSKPCKKIKNQRKNKRKCKLWGREVASK